MFRIVLHEVGHAINYGSDPNNMEHRLSSLWPHDHFDQWAFTRDGYWYRPYGRTSNEVRAPSESLADGFAAWVWNGSYTRGSVLASREHIGMWGVHPRIQFSRQTNWSAMYDLMVSFLGD
jgi:hypothetical protein